MRLQLIHQLSAGHDSYEMPSTRTKALALAFFTVAYNLVEGGVAMLGVALSSSNALLGFGLDSFVESLSGMVMVWRFWKFDPTADHEEEFEKVERRAVRLVGYSFFILGGYVVLDAGYALCKQEAPETSLIGIGLAIASIIVMPILFLLKYRLGKAIGSRSLDALAGRARSFGEPQTGQAVDEVTGYRSDLSEAQDHEGQPRTSRVSLSFKGFARGSPESSLGV